MEDSSLNHRQKDDYQSNSLHFGYLFSRGYLTFGRATAYILLKSFLVMMAVLVISDRFFNKEAYEFHSYITRTFYNWGFVDFAEALVQYVPTSFSVSVIAFLVILFWHFCGFLIGMEKDFSKGNMDQFR